MPATKLSELSPDLLQKALIAAMTEVTHAKKQLEHIECALDMRYAEQAKALRLAQGKDTGVVHFDDGKVRVTADLPKKVEWDQKQLHELVRRIASAGDNPAEYIETSYRVSETKYQAWQESLRSQFTPARTLKAGKATYRLALPRSDHHVQEPFRTRCARSRFPCPICPTPFVFPVTVAIPIDGLRLEMPVSMTSAFAIQGLESELAHLAGSSRPCGACTTWPVTVARSAPTKLAKFR